jgi:hypothetical protein
MAIASGTIASATPVTALKNAIEAVFAAHSNWTFVETVSLPAGTPTSDYHVYRNHGTGVTDNNSLGQDFYICLQVPIAGTGNMTVRAFEDYNAPSDLMIRPCMEDGTNATNADTSGLATGGVVLSTTSGAMTVTLSLSTAPNSNDYYIVLSKNVLHVALRRSDSATVYSCYAGLFNSRVTIANAFPLVLGANTTGNTNSSTAAFGTSRHPGRISQAATTNNFQHSLGAMTQTGGDTGNVDLFRGQAQASQVALLALGGAAGVNAPTFGRIRGTLYDVITLPTASGVTLGMGDVLDDPSIDYWYFGYNSAAIPCWVDQSVV